MNDELFSEVKDRFEAIAVDLNPAQIEAWASGLFELFDADEMFQFVGFMASAPRPPLALIKAVSVLADDPARAASLTALARLVSQSTTGVSGEPGEPGLAAIGDVVPTSAWSVNTSFGSSVALGFAQNGAEPKTASAAHVLLFEIDQAGFLTDIQVTGNETLFDSDDDFQAKIVVTELEIDEAAAKVLDAWAKAGSSGAELGSGVGPNQRMARYRLSLVAPERHLVVLLDTQSQIDWLRSMTSDDFERANAAAKSTLIAALGPVGPHAPVEPGWVQVVTARLADGTSREIEGLLWLEWADWLGAGIGLTRGGIGCVVSGEALVEMVNRCPEVSSTIHREDRDYAIWAFEVAIDCLVDHGLVEGRSLTELGWMTLPGSLIHAWSLVAGSSQGTPD